MDALKYAGLFSLFLMLSSFAVGEEVEIYIPGSDVDVSNEMENSTPLGRCLNTGLPEYCTGLQLEGDGTVLESFDETQITLETLIFSDTDVQLQDKDQQKTETIQTILLKKLRSALRSCLTLTLLKSALIKRSKWLSWPVR